MLPLQEDGEVTTTPEARPGQRDSGAEPRSPVAHQREGRDAVWTLHAQVSGWVGARAAVMLPAASERGVP